MDGESLPLRPMTDGVVTIRAPEEGDTARLIAGRDEQSTRYLGPGDDRPRPTACIVAAGEVVGWVDYDPHPEWLEPGEVNVGYNVFAPHRGYGYAPRAVELLIRYLGECTTFDTASLSIDADNAPSLAVAARTGFVECGDPHQRSRDFKRALRPAP